MSPWVFSQVKNDRAMSARHSANRNQVVLDTISPSHASSCCILDPQHDFLGAVPRPGKSLFTINDMMKIVYSWISLLVVSFELIFVFFGFWLYALLNKDHIFSVWKKARVSTDQPSRPLSPEEWVLACRHLKWCFSPGSSLFFPSCHPP